MLFTVLKTILSVFWSLVKSFSWLLIPIVILVVAWVIDLFFVKFRFFKGCKKEVIGHVNIVPKPNIFEQLFIQLPKQFWKNYYNKPKGQFNEHGIIMFCGAQGQGKTLAETKYLLDMGIKYPDVKICTNYGFNFENECIDNWKKLVDYNNGQQGVICAIDEIQNWFSSAMSKNFPPRMMATVTQNRKNRRVIICSAHFFNNPSKPIRIHTTEVRDCRTFLGCFTVVRRSRPIFDASGEVIKFKRLGYYSFVHSDELYNAYDTYKVISNLSQSGFKDDSFAIIQEDDSSGVATVRGRGRRRSALVESSVNSNIDNVFNSFGG